MVQTRRVSKAENECIERERPVCPLLLLLCQYLGVERPARTVNGPSLGAMASAALAFVAFGGVKSVVAARARRDLRTFGLQRFSRSQAGTAAGVGTLCALPSHTPLPTFFWRQVTFTFEFVSSSLEPCLPIWAVCNANRRARSLPVVFLCDQDWKPQQTVTPRFVATQPGHTSSSNRSRTCAFVVLWRDIVRVMGAVVLC